MCLSPGLYAFTVAGRADLPLAVTLVGMTTPLWNRPTSISPASGATIVSD
jgi:hypothetical protein